LHGEKIQEHQINVQHQDHDHHSETVVNIGDDNRGMMDEDIVMPND